MATIALNSGIMFPNGTMQTKTHSIKSVQSVFCYPRGTVVGELGNYAVNIYISPVNTAKSFILYQNVTNNTRDYTYKSMTARFLDSSTIQLSSDYASAHYPESIRIQVVEFQ